MPVRNDCVPLYCASLLREILFLPRVKWQGAASGDDWLCGKGPMAHLKQIHKSNPGALVWLFGGRDRDRPGPQLRAQQAIEAAAWGGPDLFTRVLRSEMKSLTVNKKGHAGLQVPLLRALLPLDLVPASELLAAYRAARCVPCACSFIVAVTFRLQDVLVKAKGTARAAEIVQALSDVQNAFLEVRAGECFFMLFYFFITQGH
jgi:hypothetical protein